MQMVKNLPTVQETGVQSLGWEDPLERNKTTHSRKVRHIEQLKITEQKILTDTGNNEKETAFEETAALKYYGCVTDYPQVSSFKQNK